jgi:hypothetical protein
MDVYETLTVSLRGKRPCRIAKSGEADRKVCPYIVGTSNAGELNVLYYQYDGYSRRGLKEIGSSANWRCNLISDIACAELLGESWREPAQKPKTRGKCIAFVDAEVEGYY